MESSRRGDGWSGRGSRDTRIPRVGFLDANVTRRLVRTLVLLGALSAVAAALAPAAVAAKERRPNVVMITTDDQTLDSFEAGVMPLTTRMLQSDGTTFTDAVVSTPQCCPSRATTITGQYPNNHGVEANRPGYPTLDRKSNVLPVWLQRAGYRTIHVGKYLNGYTGARGMHPAPGWDSWLTMTASDYSNPVFSVNGELMRYPDQHLSDVIGEMSVAAVERNMPRSKPLYLQVDHFAPHVGGGDRTGRCEGGAVPAPEDADAFIDEPLPRPPGFNEVDVSDKLGFIQGLEPFEAGDIDEITRHYRCALASLASVDRAIADLLKGIRKAGELSNTLVIFTSDNGYAYGEHRLATGKGLPYEEHIRVPLVIRPPMGKGFGRTERGSSISDAPVGNVDLAPTILRLAGADPCRTDKDSSCRRLDGRSLLGVLRGREPKWSEDRALRIGFFINSEAYRLSCRWEGFRSSDRVVIRHTELPDPGDGFRCGPSSAVEHYDRSRDPFQLRAVETPLSRGQQRRLNRISRCSGIRKRDPGIRGVPYCE